VLQIATHTCSIRSAIFQSECEKAYQSPLWLTALVIESDWTHQNQDALILRRKVFCAVCQSHSCVLIDLNSIDLAASFFDSGIRALCASNKSQKKGAIREESAFREKQKNLELIHCVVFTTC